MKKEFNLNFDFPDCLKSYAEPIKIMYVILITRKRIGTYKVGDIEDIVDEYIDIESNRPQVVEFLKLNIVGK